MLTAPVQGRRRPWLSISYPAAVPFTATQAQHYSEITHVNDPKHLQRLRRYGPAHPPARHGGLRELRSLCYLPRDWQRRAALNHYWAATHPRDPNYVDPQQRANRIRGIRWALGLAPCDLHRSPYSNYDFRYDFRIPAHGRRWHARMTALRRWKAHYRRMAQTLPFEQLREVMNG